jgi:hypothetical protein
VIFQDRGIRAGAQGCRTGRTAASRLVSPAAGWQTPGQSAGKSGLCVILIAAIRTAEKAMRAEQETQ